MKSARFRVFENQRLEIGREYLGPGNGQVTEFTQGHWDALARVADRARDAVVRVGRRCIHTTQFVGLIHAGPVTLEVLPKIGEKNEASMRQLLVHMVEEVADVRLRRSDAGPLAQDDRDLFDLLVHRFLDLTRRLLREGLARAYREQESNEAFFHGRLLISQHLRANHAHAERSFLAFETFDADFLLNRALFAALSVLSTSHVSGAIRSSAQALRLSFPPVDCTHFRVEDLENVELTRGQARYREALVLAGMIIQARRPDLRSGDEVVTSVLFDMNRLFESYVATLLKRVPGLSVSTQRRIPFWLPTRGRKQHLVPDILAMTGEDRIPVVIDTKWKVPDRDGPSGQDLRQLFAYVKMTHARRGILLYPRAHAGQKAIAGAFVGHDAPCGTEFVDLLPANQLPNQRRTMEQLERLLHGPQDRQPLRGMVAHPTASKTRLGFDSVAGEEERTVLDRQTPMSASLPS